MFQTFLLLALLVFAIFSVFSDNIKRSVIYLGVFSLIIAVTYLHYNAPDVALAEAAIGVGLSTVMYLVATKKVSVYDICYVNEDVEIFNDDSITEIMNSVVRPLEKFLERTEEVEPQLAYTNHEIEKIMREDNHDMFIHRKNNLTYIYGESTDAVFQDIIANLNEVITDITDIRVIYRDEVTLDDGNA
ncbi:Na(+)/H(+) antiporter subunit B [Alkalibacterium sp. f15]|uniref:Na(+)/H(+) antiporter subunit B n=1 Tax=Alkalibacterium sp. f15 TaxID=3414029 RepID=UPI003BF821D7